RLMSSVEYSDREPWPVAADGAGASLAKWRPDTDSAERESWTASREVGGTPGRRNFGESTESSEIPLFNEVSAAGDASAFWIELRGSGGSSFDLEGYGVGIAGDPSRRFVFSEQVVPEGGLTLIEGSTLGFEVFAGEHLCLYSPDLRLLMDVVEVDEVVRGRSDDHLDRWLYPRTPTPGDANDVPLETAVVINEIMYRAYPEPARPGVPAQF